MKNPCENCTVGTKRPDCLCVPYLEYMRARAEGAPDAAQEGFGASALPEYKYMSKRLQDAFLAYLAKCQVMETTPPTAPTHAAPCARCAELEAALVRAADELERLASVVCPDVDAPLVQALSADLRALLAKGEVPNDAR